MFDANTLDLRAAPRYRKKGTVLAFRLEAGATYDKLGSWGSNQEFPGPHYTIVGAIQRAPEFAGGRVISTTDVYGCGLEEFESMYQQTGGSNEFRKVGTVQALRIDEPFTVDTTTRDGNVAVKGARGEPGDYVVLQPGGERQRISAKFFEEMYEPVPEG